MKRTAEERSELAPRARLLFGLCVAFFLVPLFLQAVGNGVGSYSMFTQPVLYQVHVLLTLSDGTRQKLPMERIAPHLNRDARRVVGNAGHWFAGETQVNLLASALDDLGQLACQLAPHVARAEVFFDRDSVGHEPLTRQRVTVTCTTKGEQ